MFDACWLLLKPFWFVVGVLLTLSCAVLHDKRQIYMVHEFLIETHITIHSSFSFTPCSAAVRAQHMELAPKREILNKDLPFFSFLS